MSASAQNPSVELPPFVQERFEKINSLTGIPIDEIQKEFFAFWQTNQKYLENYKTDDEKFAYVDMVIWARYRSLRPSRDFSVIPVGYDPWRTTKKGNKKRSALYVAVKTDKGFVKGQIPLWDNMAEMYKTVNLGQGYTVKLVEGRDGNMSADRRTVFENPTIINVGLEALIRRLGVLDVPSLAEAPKFPSRMQKTSTGEFTDTLDWRLVRGIVTNNYKGVRKDGVTPMANITIYDTSIGTEEHVDDQGRTVRAGFTVWCDESLQQYGTDSEILAVGTIGVDDKGQASMNGISVIPITAFPIKA